MRKYLSFFIVLVVTSFVSVAAAIIVKASIEDSHSNVRVTEEILAKVTTPAQADEVKQEMPMEKVAPKTDEPTAPTVAECQAVAETGVPIGIYLRNKGLPRTFEYRAALASELKMASYSGTTAQNTELLARIVRKQLEEMGCIRSDEQVPGTVNQ